MKSPTTKAAHTPGIDLSTLTLQELRDRRNYLSGPVLYSARNSFVRRGKILARIEAVDCELVARAAVAKATGGA